MGSELSKGGRASGASGQRWSARRALRLAGGDAPQGCHFVAAGRPGGAAPKGRGQSSPPRGVPSGARGRCEQLAELLGSLAQLTRVDGRISSLVVVGIRVRAVERRRADAAARASSRVLGVVVVVRRVRAAGRVRDGHGRSQTDASREERQQLHRAETQACPALPLRGATDSKSLTTHPFYFSVLFFLLIFSRVQRKSHTGD